MGRRTDNIAIIRKNNSFKFFSFKVKIVIYTAVLLVAKLNTKFLYNKVEWIKLTHAVPNLWKGYVQFGLLIIEKGIKNNFILLFQSNYLILLTL